MRNAGTDLGGVVSLLAQPRRSDTVLVSTINYADQGSADVAFRTPLAPYEKLKFLGSGEYGKG
ncbi:unnamed protein product [Brassica napus]|uniref:(rape) hypothetical protein n=1 Tax=Brassica napus TaxID=3708 RepID=A0A816M7M1_BRANA|nr:unnamed protein product [Brassica napus]